eukprot:SAG31_NODE_1663_length_7581_cov_10.076399_4_plen_228_part_00
MGTSRGSGRAGRTAVHANLGRARLGGGIIVTLQLLQQPPQSATGIEQVHHGERALEHTGLHWFDGAIQGQRHHRAVDSDAWISGVRGVCLCHAAGVKVFLMGCGETGVCAHDAGARPLRCRGKITPGHPYPPRTPATKLSAARVAPTGSQTAAAGRGRLRRSTRCSRWASARNRRRRCRSPSAPACAPPLASVPGGAGGGGWGGVGGGGGGGGGGGTANEAAESALV